LATAAQAARIVEVNASADLRKVAVRSDVNIGEYTAYILEKPSRLVLDFREMELEHSDSVKASENFGGLTVRTAMTKVGARVVMDFGKCQVPEHRIKKMGSHLVVFLEDWTAPATAYESGSMAADIRPKASPGQVDTPRDNPETASAVGSDLEVKSVKVSGELVVLTVGDRKRPDALYRVDLGLDLTRMGFTVARIVPLFREARPAEAAPKASVRVMPRGARTDSVSVPPAGRHVRQETSGDSPNTPVRVASFPRQHPPRVTAPRNSAAPAPVQQQTENNVPLMVPTQSAMPTQSVTESLRSELQAPRHHGVQSAQGGSFREPGQLGVQSQPQLNAQVPAGPSTPGGPVQSFVDRLLGHRPKSQ